MNLLSPIARPPWTGLGKRLESMLRKALYTFSMIEESDHIGLALSGGKDSLTLLFLLHAVRGRGFPPFKISAFHVTGEFSCGASIDIGYLQRICTELDVDLTILESHQKLETLECYSCSRERRSLIFNAAKDKGVTRIAFGHTRDDAAETVMMNLLHKAEFAGLLPRLEMVHYGVQIIRPLIYIGEEQIIEFAKQYGFARVMCKCPVGQNSMRRVTSDLLTQLEEDYPNARENLARAGLNYGSNKAARP